MGPPICCLYFVSLAAPRLRFSQWIQEDPETPIAVQTTRMSGSSLYCTARRLNEQLARDFAPNVPQYWMQPAGQISTSVSDLCYILQICAAMWRTLSWEDACRLQVNNAMQCNAASEGSKNTMVEHGISIVFAILKQGYPRGGSA